MKRNHVILSLLVMLFCMTQQTWAQGSNVSGSVYDDLNEPVIGASVMLDGKIQAVTDMDGLFTLKNVSKGNVIRVTCMGYKAYQKAWNGQTPLRIVLSDDTKQMNQVVVTAMGIQRKEKSLTYATQAVSAEDLTKIPAVDATAGLEGKVSGLTITPSAGGAGGSAKIVLRGNQSIMGNNEPLIVLDGVPLTNTRHGQVGDDPSLLDAYSAAEGGDALSLINPDDIESMNFLKGANAAALYGSQAANGVIMITTKKGKAGKLDISVTSNVMFENPLTTPQLQRQYGAALTDNGDGTYQLSTTAWGPRVEDTPMSGISVNLNDKFKVDGLVTQTPALRNYSVDNLNDFYRTGTTFNNSVSISGGTDKVRSYLSVANSHANGMLENNFYNRNTVSLRQQYKLWDRKGKKWFNTGGVDVSVNYVNARTKNRLGGGTVLNPMYHLYMTPNNIDMAYYRTNYASTGKWQSYEQTIYTQNGAPDGYWKQATNKVGIYEGPMQNWAYQSARYNNPYWLLNQNSTVDDQERVYGYVQGNLDIWDGLSFQARLSVDASRYDSESKRYATTWNQSTMYDYGTYSKSTSKSMELYTDYLLSYNKTFKKDWAVSATAGYVGHTIKGESTNTYHGNATWVDEKLQQINTGVNIFETSAGGIRETSTSNTSKWDQAFLVTGQLGWKDAVFVDGSYRIDWYREFKQFASRGTPDHYGYWGAGATAIVSSLAKLPDWFSYLKARLSYSEVGNSLPAGIVYSAYSTNSVLGTSTVSNYVIEDPRPETTKSFEAGLEMLFIDNRLSFDVTYYNAELHNMYLVTGSSARKRIVTNSGVVRNRGVELTLGYNFKFGSDWRWRTSVNYSYNANKILKTAYDAQGNEKLITTNIASGAVQVRYKEGDAYGDMYVTDLRRYTAHQAEKLGDPSLEGKVIVSSDGSVSLDVAHPHEKYVGNMYSPHTLGWNNQINWKDFSLSFLINGRIGGHMVDLTEAYLDAAGLSQRSADARAHSDAMGWTDQYGYAVMQVPGAPEGLTSVEAYYTSIGSQKAATEYVYSATNFRLRELSIGYTFRDLFGMGRHLTLSAVGRNLFFIYKDSPTDPDVTLSTANGLGGVACFNFPSTRSFGFSVKMNF